MKKYIEFLLLRMFGIKPKRKGMYVAWKNGYTIIPIDYDGEDFNGWIRGIYQQLNPNV